MPLSGSEGQVAKEASELSGDIHPQDIEAAEGGKPVEAGDAPAEGFSGKAWLLGYWIVVLVMCSWHGGG